ncbi:MAG: SigB/SigF/SigG family RNA polymerase sigma factor [Clostridia bacterium]
MYDHLRTIALIERAKTGDIEAKNMLIEENSPLVKCVIKRFLNKGIEYDDLYQLGCLGFIKAIKNFDTSFNVRFSTYVVPMIMGEIKRFMRDDGSVKVSRAIKGLNIKINRFVRDFENEHGEKPSLELIAKEFDVDPHELIFTMDASKMPISLFTPIDDENGGKSLFLLDRLITVDNHDEIIENLLLKEALKDLEQREKHIILLRFFRDKTQSEIAKELGVSQVQVSRLENKILEKMKIKMK